MRVSMRSFLLIVVLSLAALGLTGCFQEAGTGVQPTTVGQGPAVVPPSPTPFPPTAVPATITPQTRPTLGLPSPTPETLNGGQPATGFGTPVDTKPPEAVGQLPSPSPVVGGLSGPSMTATAMITGAGGQGGFTFPTSTPSVNTLLVATATPPQLSGAEMQATALIEQFNATQAAYQTATATALGIFVPSATPLPGIPTATPDLSGDCVHVVQRGETTYRIAVSYGITVDDIAQVNGMTNPSTIHIGDELTIPACGDLTPTPGPQPTSAVPSQLTPTPGTGVEEACVQQDYVIQPGDNLYRLSLRYGVTLRALQNANNINNIHQIVAGQTLQIPCQQ